MGKLIAFWSPYRGKARVTASMCAITGAFGLWYPEYQVAISHMAPRNRELERKLYDRAGPNQELYGKFGLAALSLNYMQGILTPEKIRHCAIPLSMNSLYLFPGEDRAGEVKDVVYRVIKEYLVKEFSFVFLDVESGHGDTSRRFLQAADYIVTVLPQAPELWEQFIEEEEWLEKRKHGILIGGYLKDSKYGINCLKRRKEEGRIKGDLVGEIPMNVGFMDAMQEGRTLDYFFRNQLTKKKEENYEFMVQTKKAAKAIKKGILLC